VGRAVEISGSHDSRMALPHFDISGAQRTELPGECEGLGACLDDTKRKMSI
jgi:hypothetical protein